MKQYYVNTIFYNFGIIILFCGIFFNFFQDQSETNVLTMLIAAVLWQICSNGIQYYSFLIQDEAMMGTLEQMFLTKTHFPKIIISKTIVNVVFVLCKGVLLFLICMLIFNKDLSQINMSLGQGMIILCIFLITVITFYGIGGLFGGLSLYFKRIAAVMNVVNYFLLMFTGILKDTSTYSSGFMIITRMIPITNANILINSVLEKNISRIDIVYFLVTSAIFLLFGIWGMNFMLQKARKDGKLGQY